MVCLSVESTVNEVELFSETLLQHASHKEQSENSSCWVRWVGDTYEVYLPLAFPVIVFKWHLLSL